MLARRDAQMTVELMAVLPVALLLAAIATNALLFFSECASFDRLARNAIRVHATSPAYGVQAGQSQAQIAQELQESFDASHLQVQVSCEEMGGGLRRYKATLAYAPHLFGMGLRASLLGVSLPCLTHSTELVVDAYKPGVFFS